MVKEIVAHSNIPKNLFSLPSSESIAGFRWVHMVMVGPNGGQVDRFKACFDAKTTLRFMALTIVVLSPVIKITFVCLLSFMDAIHS